MGMLWADSSEEREYETDDSRSEQSDCCCCNCGYNRAGNFLRQKQKNMEKQVGEEI